MLVCHATVYRSSLVQRPQVSLFRPVVSLVGLLYI